MPKRQPFGRNARCYACGGPAETSEDIPPKCIYDKPRPDDIITVPACGKCNHVASLDDEYFRWMVATASSEHPSALAQIDGPITRQFKERQALLRRIFENAHDRVDVYSEGGIFIGQRPGFTVDRPRIQRTISKIVRGLYLRETGNRLPDNIRIRDWILNPNAAEEYRPYIVNLPLHEVGGGRFAYSLDLVTETPGAGIWCLYFFERTVMFLTMTDDFRSRKFGPASGS